MKFSMKWFSDYGWLILFLIAFFTGIFFIFWMGSAKIKDLPTSEIPEIKQYLLDKKSPSTSESSDLGNISPAIVPTPITSNSQLSSPDTAKELITETATEEELKVEENDLCPTLLIKRGNKVMLFNKNVPETPGENPIFFDNLEQYIQYVKKQRELYNQSCPVLFLQEEVNAQGENVYKMRTLQDADNVDPLLLGSIQDYFLSKTNVMPKFGPPDGPGAFNNPADNTEISLANYSIPYKNLPPQFKNHPPLVPYEDANRDNKPYNQGYYGFDPTSQYVGKYTVLDQIHNSTMTQNANGLSNNPMDPNWGGGVFTEEKVESGLYEGNSVQPPTGITV
tara:strand:- start:6 stop:1013 length:1008 start_codon:yes stop_codon:yes gene_type:complete